MLCFEQIQDCCDSHSSSAPFQTPSCLTRQERALGRAKYCRLYHELAMHQLITKPTDNIAQDRPPETFKLCPYYPRWARGERGQSLCGQQASYLAVVKCLQASAYMLHTHPFPFEGVCSKYTKQNP